MGVSIWQILIMLIVFGGAAVLVAVLVSALGKKK